MMSLSLFGKLPLRELVISTLFRIKGGCCPSVIPNIVLRHHINIMTTTVQYMASHNTNCYGTQH
eukprot:scaffold8230_cov94-Cylindrotheca_fusiformis.AAC.3